MRRNGPGQIAVAIHDVEPATYERCALIRDWLADHGIARVTLLVIPVAGRHAFMDRCPDLCGWLKGRTARGDVVAQHGFQHSQLRRASPSRQMFARWTASEAPEFLGLDADETACRVQAGRRMLRLAGLAPRGFVAPAYAYTPALRRELAGTFDWWASAHAVYGDHGRSDVHASAVRAGGRRAGSLLRLDIHPADFDRTSNVAAVERTLVRARDREAVSYDDLWPLSAARADQERASHRPDLAVAR